MTPDKPMILYTTQEGAVKVKLVYNAESFWLPQDGIAQLFGVGKAAISKHLKNIFEEGELSQDTTVSKMETVRVRLFSCFLFGNNCVNEIGDAK